MNEIMLKTHMKFPNKYYPRKHASLNSGGSSFESEALSESPRFNFAHVFCMRLTHQRYDISGRV